MNLSYFSTFVGYNEVTNVNTFANTFTSWNKIQKSLTQTESKITGKLFTTVCGIGHSLVITLLPSKLVFKPKDTSIRTKECYCYTGTRKTLLFVWKFVQLLEINLLRKFRQHDNIICHLERKLIIRHNVLPSVVDSGSSHP